MTKRILGSVLATAVVLGLTSVAFAAASPERPSYGLETSDEALALAAASDPPPPPPPPGPGPGARKQELRACVKPKVDAGADRRTALQECAAQLGLPPAGQGRPGHGPEPGKPGGLPRVGRAAHAELVVPKRGAPDQWETIVVDRGKVTAASADSISVQRPDGPTVTIKVVAGTKVRGATSAAELAPGREVVVVSAGGEARSIVARR